MEKFERNQKGSRRNTLITAIIDIARMFPLKIRILLIGFLTLLTFQKANAQDVQLLFPHLYFGDEIDTSLAQRNWIGLYDEHNQHSLKPAQVSITLTRHHMTDADGEQTGKRVTVSPETPLVLISGLDGLQPGPIKHLDFNKTHIHPGDTLSFEFLKKTYQLIVTSNQDKNGSAIDCKLFLNYEGKSQLLGESDFFDDTTFNVVWAGDLDGDNTLDLLMDLSYKYSFGLFTLFTSSNTKPGELLHLIAQHRIYYD